tara:strand:- start:48 stop:446 length:399 start_codon:yes stop_codon:yes gene_type:complete
MLYDNNLLKNNYENFNLYEIDKINNLINSTTIIINKLDLILLEWFKYDLLNRSSDIITQADNIAPFIFKLTEKTYNTIKIYNIIGIKILNNIDFIICITGFSLLTIITIQCISCSILIYLYRDHKSRICFIK